MYKNKSILAVIPARGGSKGIKQKNIKMFNGKPLIAWTIEAANQSLYIDRVILSSEDDEIIEVAKRYDCEVPFKRPIELAQDETPGIDPLLHAVNHLNEKYDYVVLLQCTSPLRTTVHIDDAIKQCIDSDAVSCIGVTKAKKNPQLLKILNGAQELEPLTGEHSEFSPRQKWDQLYAINGAVYVVKTSTLLETSSLIHEHTRGYVMDELVSADIDTQLDFDIAEYLMMYQR